MGSSVYLMIGLLQSLDECSIDKSNSSLSFKNKGLLNIVSKETIRANGK
jgi:hypothetical protein